MGPFLSFSLCISENPEIACKDSDFKRPCCTIVNSSRNNCKTLAPVSQSCHIHDTLKSVWDPQLERGIWPSQCKIRNDLLAWPTRWRKIPAGRSFNNNVHIRGRERREALDPPGWSPVASLLSPQIHLLHGLDPSVVDDAVLSNPGRRLKRLVEVMLSADVHESPLPTSLFLAPTSDWSHNQIPATTPEC